jgi:hypothetical protein
MFKNFLSRREPVSIRLILALLLLVLLCVGSPAPTNAANCGGQNGQQTLVTFTAQGPATVNSADQSNCTGSRAVVVVDFTTATTASVVVTIQGKDTASGKYYTLLASSALTSAATTLLVVSPGSTAAANADVAYPLPSIWRVSVVVSNNGGTAAVTGTIGASVGQ